MKNLLFSTQKFRAIQRVLETHQEAFEGKQQAQDACTSFNDLVTQMENLITELTVPKSSVYLNRVRTRQTLANELGQMLNIGIMFASRQEDEVLMNTLKTFYRRYRSVSSSEMIQMTLYFIQTITAVQELANEVGLTTERMASLQAAMDNYRQASEAVANAMGDRRSRRDQLGNLIKLCNKTLRFDFDRFVRYHATDYPSLAFSYSRVRGIRRRRPSGAAIITESDISGMITDALSGQPIVGATINLIEHATALNTETDGYYIFDELEAGDYTITCHAEGYNVPDAFTVTIGDNDSIIHNFELTPIQ